MLPLQTVRDLKQVEAAYVESAEAKGWRLPPAFDNLSEYWRPKTARAMQQVPAFSQPTSVLG